MGACLSASGSDKPLLEAADGDVEAYKELFVEDRVLGEGEFGIVKLVHHKTNRDSEFACKTLQKAAVIKNNESYEPMKPEFLQAEIQMLRTLAGLHYCVKPFHFYESSKVVLIVTECCNGGDMMKYISSLNDDIRSEDASRVAYQLLDAVNHCAQNKILHRDVKPDNVLFKNSDAGAELRLIDFGSGTMVPPKFFEDEGEGRYTTFVGTKFYNSPEMFENSYSEKTDVWSVGVTLYVLVAGYPSEELQPAFDMLMDAQRNTAKELPNMPDNMPQSYYDMLDDLLQYRQKERKSAKEMLSHDFVQFHLDLLKGSEHSSSTSTTSTAAPITTSNTIGQGNQDVSESSAEEKKDDFFDQVVPPKPTRTRRARPRRVRQMSVPVRGAVKRHSMNLDFKRFERSLTTLLATTLSTYELNKLLTIVDQRSKEKREKERERKNRNAGEDSDDDDFMFFFSQERQLDIFKVKHLKSILEDDIGNHHILAIIDKIPGAGSFNGYAYHMSMLKEFSPSTIAAAYGGSKNGMDEAYAVVRKLDDSRRASLHIKKQPSSRSTFRTSFTGTLGGSVRGSSTSYSFSLSRKD